MLIQKTVGSHSEVKSQSPCENENKKFFINGGKCFYILDEDIASCNFSGCIEEKAIKILCGWTNLEFNTRTEEKFSFQNMKRGIFCNFKI